MSARSPIPDLLLLPSLRRSEYKTLRPRITSCFLHQLTAQNSTHISAHATITTITTAAYHNMVRPAQLAEWLRKGKEEGDEEAMKRYKYHVNKKNERLGAHRDAKYGPQASSTLFLPRQTAPLTSHNLETMHIYLRSPTMPR